MKTLALILVAVLIGSPAFADDKTREAQTEDILEAVIRFRVEEDTRNRIDVSVYYLVIEPKDAVPIESLQTVEEQIKEAERSNPSDALMKRLADLKGRVRKRYDPAAKPRAADDQSALIVVKLPTWKSDAEVEVRGYSPPSSYGYKGDRRTLAQDSYELRKENGAWKVHGRGASQ